MAEARGEWPDYCFLLLNWGSVDIRDLSGRKMEAAKLPGGRGAESPKWKKLGRGSRIIAPFSSHQIPWKSVDIRDVCGRTMGEGELLEKRGPEALNGRN